MTRNIGHIVFSVAIVLVWHSHAATIRGRVVDQSKEPMIGSHIVLKNSVHTTVAGLDGSFQLTNIPVGQYTITVSYIGYQTVEQNVDIQKENDVVSVSFELTMQADLLNEIVVVGFAEGGTEMQARSLERNAANTINVISAKAIALSPDISVANVVQRVSGLSVERNSNGDPQYAIVRGMDKRYNYTLVNGVKIPSPDNKNRYVPLDIFPATLLERLEVYKSLTADLEGDAIGGGINMVMKSAPESFEVKGDFQLGYNYINVRNGFNQFDASSVRYQSPREKYGSAYLAQTGDFSYQNGVITNSNPFPDFLTSVSVGTRVLRKKLGIMVGGSFQNAYRGTESVWFDTDTDRFGSNLPSLRSMEDRYYSAQQYRMAVHSRLDYRFSKNHSLNLYTGYYNLKNMEARETNTTYLDGRNYSSTGGNAILAYSTRTRIIDQKIFNTTLQGDHKLLPALHLTWSGVVAKAGSDRPDNLRFDRNGELKNFVEQPINVERRNPRQWESNNDQDYTIYLNFIYKPQSVDNFSIKTGGMYRTRNRDNYYNRYLFDPNPSPQIQGVDWNVYTDVRWQILNPAGSATDELNYNANEQITAAYGLTSFTMGKLDVNTGLRAEFTEQGYTLKSPKINQTPDSTQTYADLLPSLSLKYKAKPDMNIRFTYYKAIARPGYFEIVPYVIEQDGYDDVGNPGLKRTRAHNIDLRWEYFPRAMDQLLIGAFYKNIEDPIEYAVVREGVNNEPVNKPGNYGTAHNLGIEVDFSKFFNKIGIKGNYTFTNSRITSRKALRTREDPSDITSDLITLSVDQTRSLQGQARHIGNLALLYKDIKNGLESQVSAVYTGERLDVISPFLDNDWYSAPILQLDFSLEKTISSHIEVFVKAMNLLNSPYEVFIKKPLLQEAGSDTTYPHQDNPDVRTLVRRDLYYQSVRMGARFNF